MTTKLFEGCKILFLHLWWSISSVDFYQRLYKSYNGYGIKYIFTISFISTLTLCLFLLNFLVNLESYFVNNKASKETVAIEYVLRQFPDINYDGEQISVNEEMPLFLSDPFGRKLVVIDLNNDLNYQERNKIPIVLTKDKIIVSIVENTDKARSNMPLPYKNILGNSPLSFTQDSIKQYLGEKFGWIIKLFIYIGMPMYVCFRFLGIILEKILIIILLYIVTNVSGIKTSMETSVRLVMFSSGVVVILQPIAVILIPTWSSLIWIVQLWSNLLMILAILKVRNNEI